MGDKILCDASDLTPIADAVREVTGETKAYSVIELGEKATNIISQGAAASLIEEHNTAADSHGDIRELISSIDSDKLDKTELTNAVNNALAQAKASGEFNGEQGYSIHALGTGFSPTYGPDAEYPEIDLGSNRLSTKIGDLIIFTNSGDIYKIISKYSAYQLVLKSIGSIKPIEGIDYFTADDKADMVAQVKAALTNETWTFTLADGSTVTKKVLLG